MDNTKNLSIYHYAQDMGALILDLNELSEACERSLIVRSKVTRSQTWCKKLKRDTWTQLLSGRILKHSLTQTFTKKLTSSVGAFLANHLAPRAQEMVTVTPATCGHISKEEFSLLDLPLFCSKTYKEYLAQNSGAHIGKMKRERPYCYTSLESWNAWIIGLRRAYSQRVKSAPLIRENEFLYSQYLTNSQEKAMIKSTHSLSRMKALHLTPPPVDVSSMNGKPRVQWPTPSASEDKARLQGNTQASKSLNAIHKRNLSPRWVEQLMGLPVGWVQATCSQVLITEMMSLDCLEMGSSLKQQQKLSLHYGKNWPTPNSRDHKDGVYSVPSSVGKTRGPSLGQALGQDFKNDLLKWVTPIVRQRGDTVEVYLRRCIKRIKQGRGAFSIPLETQVEAESKAIEIDFKSLDYSKDTEDLIKEIMNND